LPRLPAVDPWVLSVCAPNHPKIVSEMLGHSQIAITLDLYSHVTATMQQEAVRAFEGLFGSQVGSQEGATEH
jgi:hypothetical protein